MRSRGSYSMLEILSNAIRKIKGGRGDKKHTTGKEEIKLSRFSDDIIVYVEKPQEIRKNILELMSSTRSQDAN